MSEKIVIKDCNMVEDGLYKNNNEISDVVICEGVLSIGKEAFSGCKSLRFVFLPKSINFIANSAFSGSGVLLNIPNEERNGYMRSRTMMIFCSKNSYADIWFRGQKSGYIIVNKLKIKDKC